MLVIKHKDFIGSAACCSASGMILKVPYYSLDDSYNPVKYVSPLSIPYFGT
jgi:hypothetical protein